MLTGLGALARSDEAKEQVKERALDAPHKVKVKVRMEAPYTADVPLQVVCYFKYTPEGVKRMSGAPVDLDKHRSEEHTSELQSHLNLVCRLLLEEKKHCTNTDCRQRLTDLLHERRAGSIHYNSESVS